MDENDYGSNLDSMENRLMTVVDNAPRTKFLHCLAEIFSHSRGWQYVTVTAMREYQDYIEVDLARNGAFDIDMICGQAGKDAAYISCLQKSMAAHAGKHSYA
jgi:hypothetical protein